MKTYFKYIIIFLLATVTGCIFTTATAQTVPDTTRSTKIYSEQLMAISKQYIEVEEKDGKANFRVLDCDSCMFRIYNIATGRVFSCKIRGDVWLCSVPLKPGIYVIIAGRYMRAFTMIGTNISTRKYETKCR